jgi:hypothetical protein
VRRWARVAFEALDNVHGELVVRSSIDRGIVLVDGEVRATLVNGVARLRLPEGRFKIALEADGYRRREEIVVITFGDTTTLNLELRR